MKQKGVLVPSNLIPMTPQRYVACFKRSLMFHLGLLSIESVQKMDRGAKRELIELVCEDVRLLYKISDSDNKVYREAAMKSLDAPQKEDGDEVSELVDG